MTICTSCSLLYLTISGNFIVWSKNIDKENKLITRVKEVYNVEGTSQIVTLSMHLNLKHLFYSIPADGNSMLCLQTENHAYANQFLNYINRNIWAPFAALKQRHI